MWNSYDLAPSVRNGSDAQGRRGPSLARLARQANSQLGYLLAVFISSLTGVVLDEQVSLSHLFLHRLARK
jgi:hypothetical protein